MILIGLGHRARQGKDYVANYMAEALSGIRVYSFAKALKEHCKANHVKLLAQFKSATGFTGEVEQKVDPIYGYTRVLQWYGTYARETDADVWVKVVAQSIERDKPQIAIITDVRFPNEAAFVKTKNGYTCECIRVMADGSQFTDPGRDPKHISETALDDYDWDFTIRVKDGDLRSLQVKALGVLQDCIREEAMKTIGGFEPDTTEEAWEDLAALPDSTGFPS